MSGVGSKIKMNNEKQRYTVMARDRRFVIMTKPFNVRKTYLYSIADLERGIRGPCNLIFGLANEVDSPEGAEEALSMLQRGEMEVSRRHGLDLTVDERGQLGAKP